MEKIAVIGAGKMGGFIARQLPAAQIIIIDRDLRAAESLASALGAQAGSDPVAIKGTEAAVIAVPGPAVDRAAAGAAPHLPAEAIVVNVATGKSVSGEIKAAFPALRFVEAKIIGNALFMEMGGGSLVVVDTPDPAVEEKLRWIFPKFGAVTAGDVDMAASVNELATAEALRAGVRLRGQLKRLGAPEDWQNAAIESVCAGTLTAYARRELGPFAMAMAEAIAGEESSGKEG